MYFFFLVLCTPPTLHLYTSTAVTSNIHQQAKQRTQERRIKSGCVCVALVSVVGRVGGYWMSWRLAFDSPPINNKQPTTSQPKNGHRSDTSSHDVFVSLLCPLFGVLVDIGCHGGWPTTAHQSTTDDQQQPTNNPPKSGHRSDNQQPTANQPSNLPPTSQPPAPMIPGERNPSSENRSSDGPAGCAEHLHHL